MNLRQFSRRISGDSSKIRAKWPELLAKNIANLFDTVIGSVGRKLNGDSLAFLAFSIVLGGFYQGRSTYGLGGRRSNRPWAIRSIDRLARVDVPQET